MFRQLFFILLCCSISVPAISQQTIKPPVKDVKRLMLLPSQPPTRAQIVSSLQQSVQEIQQRMAPGKITEVTKFTATQPIETIQQKAIMDFYSDDPKGAVLMMMQTAAKAPDSLLLLNNLGAMLNLHAAEHKAIPLLQYCLQKMPNNSIVLNNIGQSFLGLGDMLKAAAYFNQCLSIDSLNIEANHSMGMLHYFKQEYDAAMKYFERELSVAARRSTLAMAYKMGRKFNLRAVMQRRQRRNGAQKDHFEEITMGKFSFPNMPQTTTEIFQNQQFYSKYASSLQAESLTWTNYANKTLSAYTSSMGRQHPGLYSDLVQAMLDELHEEFTPEYLTNFTSDDHQNIMEIIATNTTLLAQLKCPEPPAGASIDAQEAYEIKCCREIKQPVADRMVKEISDYISPIIKKGEARWKAYINQLVDIVQLDPGISNQAMVYNAVAGYFNYLSLGAAWFSAGEVNNFLPKCFAPYDSDELDSLIESDREWQVSCPAWLNVEVDFDGVVLKVDCNKYVIEAGESIMGAFEHEFQSGKSTLLFGPGAKGEFLGIKGEVKNQFFLTFDKNKEFSDFGIKSTAEVGLSGTPIHIGPNIKFGGNLAGIEISNVMSIISGYSESVELKGAATWFK